MGHSVARSLEVNSAEFRLTDVSEGASSDKRESHDGWIGAKFPQSPSAVRNSPSLTPSAHRQFVIV
jgi:hypothetical protein